MEVLRLGGAPDPRNCRRNQGSEASRSSRSSELSTKSRFRGLAELQVIENIDDIELRRPRGAPSRAFHADTGARRGALASISEESRSSKSSKTLTKSTFGGFEELQVGNSTRTRERDGGLQPPIERLVYIYIYKYIYIHIYIYKYYSSIIIMIMAIIMIIILLCYHMIIL